MADPPPIEATEPRRFDMLDGCGRLLLLQAALVVVEVGVVWAPVPFCCCSSNEAPALRRRGGDSEDALRNIDIRKNCTFV